MKNLSIFFFVLVCFISLNMMSCKKYYSTTDTQVLEALTDTFSITSDTSWIKDTVTKDHYTFTKSGMANLSSNDTNTSIIDSGAVLIYLSVDTGKTYELLPANYINNFYFKGQASDGEVSILAYNSAITKPEFPVYIKVISFPSFISFKSLNFDPQNYSETIKAIHLEN